MLTIEKQKPVESNVTKLVIKTSKDSLVTTKVEPKELKATKQAIQPEEPENIDSLFIIY
jgi:hypothetical protein